MAQATSNNGSSADQNVMISDGSIAVKVSRRFDSPRYTKKETKNYGTFSEVRNHIKKPLAKQSPAAINLKSGVNSSTPKLKKKLLRAGEFE